MNILTKTSPKVVGSPTYVLENWSSISWRWWPLLSWKWKSKVPDTVALLCSDQLCRSVLWLLWWDFLIGSVNLLTRKTRAGAWNFFFISKIFLEKSINQKWKIHEKLVTDFLELIGFIYIKTTVSISRLTSFLRFGKRCFLAKDISNSLSFFILHFCKYLWLRSIVSQTVKKSLTVRSRRPFWCI